MPQLSVSELDLLSFFEVVPKLRDPEEEWGYNDALYEVERAELMLSFSLAPSYGDVRLILSRAEDRLYELNAMRVQDVKYHNDGGRESLSIVVNEHEHLLLRLKPTIAILHEAKPKT